MVKIFLIALILSVSWIIYSYSYSKYYNGPISDHFDGTRFFDPDSNYNKSFLDVIKWRLTAKFAKWPNKVAGKQFDFPPERVTGDELRVSYVGHVTFLIQTQGLNILTDPLWSDRASPVSFAGPKRVIDPGIKFENLPPIDIIWVSHNHYDHLDLKTLELLWRKFRPRIITPLGNDTIIKNYNSEIQVEAYDWGDEVAINKQIKFYLEPMQHWSARNLLDRNKALWAALVINSPAGNIYFVGDSGYGMGRYFKKAKEKFGQFRLALLPMGAYEPRWFMEYAHMDPEEMVRAYLDLGKPSTIPCHYDIFKLTGEAWGEAKTKLEEAKNKFSTGNNIKVLEPGEFWQIP